jgi:hypothetical protein
MPPHHHHEFVPYPTPDEESVAEVLGSEWAEVSVRVIGDAPYEQAAIADLIVCAYLNLRDEIDQLQQQVARLIAIVSGEPDADSYADEDEITDEDEGDE